MGNGKPHCRAEGVPQITRQECIRSVKRHVFSASEKKEMAGVKLITMMTLQLNVLDDVRQGDLRWTCGSG